MVERVVAGIVNADGSRRSGDDFTVSRASEGHYLVSFRPAFTNVSGGSATQIYDGNTLDNAVIIRLNNSELYVKTGDSNGNARDRPFTFVSAGEGSHTSKKD